MTSGDPTLGGIRDPALRLRKLNERRQHIEDQIHDLQDKHYLIEIEEESAEIARIRNAQVRLPK